MPADTTVKHFDSSMTGAPQITVASSTSAGKLIDVLVACLRDGFGLVTVTSLVVSGGVATATIAGGHPAKLDSVVLLAGSTPAELNGEKKATAVTATTVQFDATGIADQTATGTITLKMAPAGWLTPFSGTNLIALKSGDVGASQGLLRLDDTGATEARAVSYETMSDINTGTGKTPSDAQVSGGHYISRGNTTAGTRKWWIIANARFVHIGIAYQSGNADAYQISSFGDVASRKTGDAYKFALFASGQSRQSVTPIPDYSPVVNYPTSGSVERVIQRSYTQVGGSTLIIPSWNKYLASAQVASGVNGAGHWMYPNGSDNGVMLSEILLTESASGNLRGAIPGVYACPQAVNGAVFQQDERLPPDALPGRVLVAKIIGQPVSSTNGGVAFFDVTGPWAS